MHPVTRAAFQLWNLRRSLAAPVLRIVVAPDPALKMFAPEVESLFAGWQRLPVVVTAPGGLGQAVQPGDAVLLVTDAPTDPSLRNRLIASGCAAVLDAAYPAQGTFDADCLREIAHHEFELGGLNEWNGQPTLHAAEVLRRLSATHCRLSFPEQILGAIGVLRPGLSVVDIGCGPISLLRWGQIHLGFKVTGFDPLLGMYDYVKRRHGLQDLPSISPDVAIEDVFENAPAHLEPGSIDLLYSNNALDHVQDFARCIRNVAAALRPGGLAVIAGSTMEGTRQGWDQFHKTDIWIERGVPMFRFQHSAPAPLLQIDPRLALHSVIRADDEVVCFILRRQA